MRKLWTVLAISLPILIPALTYAEQTYNLSGMQYSAQTDEPAASLEQTQSTKTYEVYSPQTHDEMQVQIIVSSGQIKSAEIDELMERAEVSSLPKDATIEFAATDE